MKDCFLLRFNCQKSGLDIPTNSSVFANLFEESEECIADCLKQYEKINTEALKSISEDVDIEEFKKRYRNKRILFVGDSITSDRLSYGKIIGKILPDNVIDRAVSGSRSVDAVATVYKHCVELKPDYVSLLIGSNDSVCIDKNLKNTSVSIDEYARNLNIIIDKVKECGADLIINSIPPIFARVFNKDNPYWSASDEINALFNETALKIAQERNVAFNDFRMVFDDENIEDMFEPDGIHLSPYAHKKIAEKLIVKFLNI